MVAPERITAIGNYANGGCSGLFELSCRILVRVTSKFTPQCLSPDHDLSTMAFVLQPHGAIRQLSTMAFVFQPHKASEPPIVQAR
jgi:hypothetical protein